MAKRRVKISGYRTKKGVYVKPSIRDIKRAPISRAQSNREAFNRNHVVSAADYYKIEMLPKRTARTRNSSSWVKLNNKTYLMKDNQTVGETVNEIVGSTAARMAGVPCNNVRIIPNRVSGQPVNRTLHEAVPGAASSSEYMSEPSDLVIADPALSYDGWLDSDFDFSPSGLPAGRPGNIVRQGSGNIFDQARPVLNSRSIGNPSSILKREDASKIYAMDAFFGHGDRHGENVVYSAKDDKFTAIDNGLLVTKYSSDTRKAFRQQIEGLDPRNLSASQKKNLRIVDATIGKLQKAIPTLKVQSVQTAKALEGHPGYAPKNMIKSLDEAEQDSHKLREIIQNKLNTR